MLILAHLSVLEGADLLLLLRQTMLTMDNLSSHVRQLEDAGFVDVERSFVDRLPLTVYRITEVGRVALEV